MNDHQALVVENLHKTFRLPHEKHTSLKQTVLNWHKRSYEEQEVLKGLDFEVEKGEFFGIVGRNGSGKSTLLKTIAGIYHPDEGGVMVNGQLTPFIELGIGFNNELTGRDNVFLNGAILGLSRKEVEEKYDEIVAFSELEGFMDQKLKNYSSGMHVRLAFSIAIQAHNEMLLIDEVLAVGDAAFQRKCFDVFKKMRKQKKTVVFVSHDMDAIQEYCDRAILIHDGEIVHEGDPVEVASSYNRVNFDKNSMSKDTIPQKNIEGLEHFGSGDAIIRKIHTENKNGKKTKFFKPKERVVINLEIEANKQITSPLIGLQLENDEGAVIFATTTELHDIKGIKLKKDEKAYLECRFDNYYGNGSYYVSAAIKDKDRAKLYDLVNKAHKIDVAGWKGTKSLTYVENELTLKKDK